MTRDIIKGLKLKTKKGMSAQAVANAVEEGFLAMRRPDKEWTEKTTFSPSTIGYGHGTCPRYWYIVFTGLDTFTDQADALGVANMGIGSHIHDDIQTALEKAGVLVEAETEITIEDPPIRGFLDAMIKIEDEEAVVEIKTTRQESFVFKEASGKPSANHLIQILTYMRATGKKHGFLLYVNKNDQTFLVIPVTMDEKNEALLDDVFDWLRTVRNAFDQGNLPIIPFTRARNSGEPTNKICRACPVNKACFSSEQGTVSIPLMEVPQP